MVEPQDSSNSAPNLYLIGGPRCGISALCEYLRDHPYVFFPPNSKPQYWASDFPGLRRHLGLAKLDDYLQLYTASNNRHTIRGDGSTMYLASEKAIDDILELCPTAKFVLMLRNPVDVVISLHRHLCNTGDEPEHEIESAWALQDEPAKRRARIRNCRESGLLKYRKVARLGHQLQLAKQRIPDGQLLTLFFEDFRDNPRRLYQQSIEFLELPDDDRREFPLFDAPRSDLATRLIQAPLTQRLYSGIRSKITGRIATAVKESVMQGSPGNGTIRDSFRSKLVDEFADEVRLLRELTGRNLDHWK